MFYKWEFEVYFGVWVWVMKERRRVYSELVVFVLMERLLGLFVEWNKDIRNCFVCF